jgi:four helix bundle protein
MEYAFKKLRVWQKSHEMALKIYQATGKFPSEEKYGLTGQLRRAAVSVATNIVEGQARKTEREFSRFLNVAEGSLEETKYLLMLSPDLGYLDEDGYVRISALANDVGRMLSGFQKRLSSQRTQG